jgi:ABC-type multidrug transport system ATPase subunit
MDEVDSKYFFPSQTLILMSTKAYNFYGFVALTLNEFTGPGTGSTGVSYGCHPSASSVNPNCVEYTGAYIIQALGFSRTWLWKSVAICVCFALVFLLVAGAVLTISKNDVEVVKIKQKTEIPTHGYGNPISRPSNKVRQAVLALQEHGLEVRNRHLFARSSSKIILEPVTASFPPGKINVIMGPSGSGKTSLLRSLARKVKDRVSTSYQISGNITLNGTPATDDMIKSSISFVTQDDEALMPALTVRETLRFAAGIRLPSSMTKEQKRQRAEDLIIQMGLRQCADTMIGSNLKRGISGGEKRRVSIAIQILADPLILLLDEPTSGLDVWTANSVLDVLRALADEGRTIIMTAHQCRSDAFKTFDNVLLLARGGSVVYTGAAGNILSHFSAQGFDCGVTTNPADFILDLITVDLQHQDREDISRKRVEDLAHNWQTVQSHPQPLRESASEVGDQVQQLSRSSNPFMETFLLVLKRSGLNISRNPEAIIARTMQTIGMVLLFTLFFTPLKSNAEAIQTRMVRGLNSNLKSSLLISKGFHTDMYMFLRYW